MEWMAVLWLKKEGWKMKVPIKNCAIYTRKSTEEGLDQDFNSLDAQREACEAYITSQKAEGWRAISAEYNDGGFSGGNIERPALRSLLADIKAGKIQTVVVYKIDRLTRSLMDFSKLVEIFDEHGVTFVSVTQSFNTTTSMGRLTLNVLLSFAQFEREVTGERIRDKIAASKKKGMWMGGFPPIGYQRVDKKLIPHPDEQETVRYIFESFLKLKSIKALKYHLEERGYKTPNRVSKKERQYGGAIFSRGHLYRILQNPVYVGQVRHKGQIYDGQHEAIINEDLFNKVQKALNAKEANTSNAIIKSGSLLQGLLHDDDGTIYSPTYTSKKGKRYHYYISQNLLQYKNHPKGVVTRLPAHEIEKTVCKAIEGWFCDLEVMQTMFPQCDYSILNWIKESSITLMYEDIRNIVMKIVIAYETITIHINPISLVGLISKKYNVNLGQPDKTDIAISLPFKPKRVNNGAIIIHDDTLKDPLDLPSDQLKRIVKGLVWRDEHFAGQTCRAIAKRENHGENYVNRCIRESFEFLSA